MAELTYSLRWTCRQCKTQNARALRKREAAFFESLRPKPGCKRCGSRARADYSVALPKIDDALLEIWFVEKGLCFLSQDEDLLIADADVKHLKAFLARDDSSPQRAAALGPSMAVKLNNGGLSEEDALWVTGWLRANEAHWQGHVMAYIRKKVHRILGDTE